MPSNVLEIGALVDVSAIQSGMGEAASVVDSATAGMSANFKELADTTINSDEAMIVGMAKLTESIDVLAAAFQEIPARAVPAIRETEGALAGLQERFIGAAETAKISATGIGGAFSGIGKLLGVGIAAGFFLHFIDETQETVLQMEHLSDRTGFAIETIAGLKYATDAVGISMDAVTQGLGRLLRAQELATQGGKGQIQAFHDIGLGVSQIKDLAPEQFFFTVGKAIAQTTSAADANAAAFALLGRGGGQLIPLFKDYGDQLQVVVDEHGKLSLVTKAAGDAAVQYKQVLADMSETIRSIMIPVMELAVKIMKGWQDAFVIFAATADDVFLNIEAGAENLVTALVAVSKANWAIISGQASEAPKIIAAAHAQIAANSDETSKVVEQVWTQAYARIKAIMAKPLNIPIPNEPPHGTKLNEDKGEKELLDAQLKEKLAAIDAWKAAQKVAYAEGTIDTQTWIAAETEADVQAYAAHETYFAKVKALFAGDPTKLATARAEQLDFEYKNVAKTSNELATETQKLNKELLKMGEEATKTQLKEFDKELKDTDKATLELAKSLSDLAASQRELHDAQTKTSFASQEEAIKECIALGTISEREGANQLKALYREEEQDQLNHLNAMVANAQSRAAELRSALVADPHNLYLRAQLNEAEAALNQDAAKRIAIEEQAAAKISKINAQMFLKIRQEYNQITGQINSAVAGWILGQETFAQAMHQIWSKIATDIINYILKIGEKFIEEQIIMAAVAKIFGTPVSKTASRAAEASSIIQDDTAQASADVFLQAIEGIPFPANLLAAPAAAAAVETQMGAFAAQVGAGGGGGRFFAQGGIVPHDMPAFLHAKEMVLPPSLSEGFQGMIASGGRYDESRGGAGGDEQHFHAHYNAGGNSFVDSTDAAGFFKKNEADFFKTMRSAVRRGAFNPKWLL